MTPTPDEDRSKPLVISLHGIRTRGAWQKQLHNFLEEAGFRHRMLDYGWFPAVKLYFSWSRRKKVRWFWEEYEDIAKETTDPPHVIAHSFGSYIACEALRTHPGIRMGRVVLCGSIVSPNFPWSALVEEGRVEQVLNDYGTKDIWAQVVGWAVPDAGPSGKTGFSATNEPALIQRELEGWSHSDFFNDLNFGTWARFLREGQVNKSKTHPTKGGIGSLVARLVSILLPLLLIAAAGWLVTRPKDLHDEDLAIKYGESVVDGTVIEPRFFREKVDAEYLPKIGDIVSSPVPQEAFLREPRRLVARNLGEPRRLEAGERLEVIGINRDFFLGFWIRARIEPRPDSLRHYRYIFRFSYAGSCPGFLMERDYRWAEFTPGSNNTCVHTEYNWQLVEKSLESVILYSNGQYLKIPIDRGYSYLAGPNLAPGLSVEGLDWSKHHWVVRIPQSWQASAVAGPRVKPLPEPEPPITISEFPLFVSPPMITQCATRGSTGGNGSCSFEGATVTLEGITYHRGIIYTQAWGEGHTAVAEFQVPSGARSLWFTVGNYWTGDDCGGQQDMNMVVQVDGIVQWTGRVDQTWRNKSVPLSASARTVILKGESVDQDGRCDDAVWTDVHFE